MIFNQYMVQILTGINIVKDEYLRRRIKMTIENKIAECREKGVSEDLGV
ncbi:MAG TPA: hypothetical protein GXX37_15280 [Clostridiaceae bacterium]|nr:hypothetical protein [Clostridiaceae bacterium]